MQALGNLEIGCRILKSYVLKSCLRSSISPTFSALISATNVQFKTSENEEGRNKFRRDCLVVPETSASLQFRIIIIAGIRDETVINTSTCHRYFMVHKMICEDYHTHSSKELHCYLIMF